MARPSAIYRSSQTPATFRTRYKFPVLEQEEIIRVSDALDFGITENMLIKPTPSFMNTLIEQILDKFLYISPYSLRKTVQCAHIDDVADEGSLRTSLNMMVPYHIVYKFLCDCGVTDFSIRDVSKPDAQRVRIILSAVINFARFREERMNDCDGLLDESDAVVQRYRYSLEQNNDLQNRLTSLEDQIQGEGYNLDDIDEHNDELETRLKELRTEQKTLAVAHDKYKLEKGELVGELEKEGQLYLQAEKDLSEMRPYVKESPDSVQELMARLQGSLAQERTKLSALEDQQAQVSVTLESVQLLIQEFQSLRRTLQGAQDGADRQGAAAEQLRSVRKQVEQSRDAVQECNRKIAQTQRQLDHNEERMTKLAKFYEAKLQGLQDKLADKNADLQAIHAKRAQIDHDIAVKKNQIKIWQQQAVDLEQALQAECQRTTTELNRLSSRIKLYITEMGGKLDQKV